MMSIQGSHLKNIDTLLKSDYSLTTGTTVTQASSSHSNFQQPQNHLMHSYVPSKYLLQIIVWRLETRCFGGSIRSFSFVSMHSVERLVFDTLAWLGRGSNSHTLRLGIKARLLKAYQWLDRQLTKTKHVNKTTVELPGGEFPKLFCIG